MKRTGNHIFYMLILFLVYACSARKGNLNCNTVDTADQHLTVRILYQPALFNFNNILSVIEREHLYISTIKYQSSPQKGYQMADVEISGQHNQLFAFSDYLFNNHFIRVNIIGN
jgi:hypothetical protein